MPSDWPETKLQRGSSPWGHSPVRAGQFPALAGRAVGSQKWLVPQQGCEPSLPSLCLWRISGIVLPPAGPAEVKVHSSAPTEHSFGDLWLVLTFFYLNNSPALALKLLSSSLDVTFASRYQFFVCTQHTETSHWDNSTVLKWNCCTRQSVVKQNCVNDWHNDIPSLDNLIWSHVYFSFSNFKQIITLESKILLIPFM